MKVNIQSKDKQISRKTKFQLYKKKKKRSDEEDSAIQYLQGLYDKIVPDEIKLFKDFPLSQKTLKGLKDNNYITPTEIQRQAIGYGLQGKDILGAAKTGSGKTLAFLIPVLEKLFCNKWTRLDGVGALIISPTRELAYQIYNTLRKIGHLHDFSAGLIIGGQNLKFERKRMDQINILICTPGRLLQHMDENPLFNCNNLQILVLDEADRCLDMGFEATMNAIIENLPPKRQTLLFSATQTKSVKDLARLSLSFPTYVAPHEQAETVTPEQLQQSYIICNIDEKIGILWSFIRNHLKQKVLIFMATCKQVKYIYDLFCKLRPGISLLALHGKLHQEKREKIYNEFCRKSNVVLFATDLASRGLDFPRVNWVIQMDCPEDVETYIHRAGRTARGTFGKGEGLMMLMPHEEKFVEDLRTRKIPINKIAVDPSKVIAPQKKIEALLSDHVELKQTAQRAFVSYVKSIYLMKNKDIFNLKLLDTDAYSRSLGLIVPPRIKFLHKYQTNIQSKAENKEADNNKAEVLKKLYAGSDTSDSDSEVNEFINQPNKLASFKTNNIINASSDLDFSNVDNENSDEEDFLHIKNKNVSVESSNVQDTEYVSKKKSKPITKAAVAKKILKKKLKVNTKVTFNDDGDVLPDDNRHLKSEIGKKLADEDTGGINIEKAMELLREEDKYDKARFREKIKAKHKEQKKKLKNKNKKDEYQKDDFGSQSESDGPDLSWLPDPDEVYEKNTNEVNKEDEIEELKSNYLDQRPTKRKLTTKQSLIETSTSKKVKKVDHFAASSLSIEEAEAVAMSLLHK